MLKLSIILALSTLLVANIGKCDELGRGPVEFRNNYPLSISQLTLQPHSPAVLGEAGALKTRSAITWSNTYNDDPSLTVDEESQIVLPSLTIGLSKHSDLLIALPIYRQGGGILDRAIDDWHKLFGLPGGGRSLTEHNQFKVNGKNEDNSSFNLEEAAIGIGNLSVEISHLWHEENNTQIGSSFSLQLPSGARRYSNDKLEFLVDTTIAKKFNSFIIYAGVGYAHSLALTYQGAKLERHRPGAFISAEYLLDTKMSIGTSYLISAHPNGPVQVVPKDEHYLDLFFSYQTNDNDKIELALRENPVSGSTTTDISAILALTKTWGKTK